MSARTKSPKMATAAAPAGAELVAITVSRKEIRWIIDNAVASLDCDMPPPDDKREETDGEIIARWRATRGEYVERVVNYRDLAASTRKWAEETLLAHDETAAMAERLLALPSESPALLLNLSVCQRARIDLLAQMLQMKTEEVAVINVFTSLLGWSGRGNWVEFQGLMADYHEDFAERRLANTPGGEAVEDDASSRVKKRAGYVSAEVAQ
jgi:hypothetical protein